MKHFYRNQGFNLVEVLVSMVIITTAVLGTAGMQSNALRQHKNTHIDEQAAYLAQELREMILSYEHTNYPGLFSSVTPNGSHDCYNAACTQTQMAEHLMWNWRDRVHKSLPLSQYQLVYSATERSYLLHIVWDAEGNGAVETLSANSCVNALSVGRGKYCLVVYPNG